MLYTHLQLPILIPLWLSLCVTFAVIASSVVTSVALKFIFTLGFIPSNILFIANDVPPFVPSHNLAYTLSPWTNAFTLVPVFDVPVVLLT